jgi:sugar-phosphatase
MRSLERLPAALLVDLDGTIADSRPALRACFESFLRARRIEPRPGDFELFDGVSLPQIPERLRARYRIDEPVDELRNEYEEAVSAAYAAVQPAPGTRELVRFAHNTGVALALVTAAPRRLATGFLASSGLLASFAAIIAGEDALPKPDPGLFLEALRQLRVAPDDAVAVEDSSAGVASALGAGLRVVGVAREPARAVALAKAGARPVLSDLRQLASAFAPSTDPKP